MRKEINTSLMIVLLMLFVVLFDVPLVATINFKPGVEYLRQDYYEDPAIAWAAFVSEDVQGNPLADIYGFGLTADQITEAINDPDIILAEYAASDMFEFDLNNNYTIDEYPGIVSPMSVASFRRALSHLCDKTTIIDVILQGYAYRLDVPLPGPQQGLFDPSGIDPGEYPYVFSLDAARAELVADGFTEGLTGPLVTGGDNVRVYPPGHSKEGEDLDPIIFYPRSDSPPRLASAEMLRDEMLMVGIPVDWRPSNFAAIYGPVFTDRNFHIYTGGWKLVERFPKFLFRLYHSDWWVDGVPFPNYVTGKDNAGNPVHPELDTHLDDIFFATDYGQMMYGVQEGMEYMFNNSVTIPLWSTVSYCAYRRGLLGVVNMHMFGIANRYTWLNVDKRYGDTTTVVVALVTPPLKLNPYYTGDFYGWQVMNSLYDGLLSFAPYEVYRTQPWVAQDWDVTLWVDPEDGMAKTKITWWFRKDNFWSDGVQFTAEDYLFSMWNLYAYDDSWMWDATMDIHHVELVDLNGDGWNEAIVYMNELSMWQLYSPTFPLVPKHIYTQASFSTGPNPLHTKHTGTYSVVGGVVQLPGVPTYVESVTGLERFTEWNIFMAPNPTSELRITTADTSVEVTWWEKGAADGYTMGNIPATEIMISNGALQIIEEVPGADGYALLQRNQFRAEPIPKGEIDFYWYWVPQPKPRCGYYIVDIADAGTINLAMGTAGYGPGLPPEAWEPGCDIASTHSSWGHIDTADFDTAVFLGWYLKKFGIPPDIVCDGSFDYPSYPTVSVNPENVTLYVNNPLVIRVEVFNLTDTEVPDPNAPFYKISQGNLWSLSLNMTWNASVLQYINHIVTIPVETHPDGILHLPSVIVRQDLNSTGGLYNLQASSQSPAAPFNNPDASSIVFEMAFEAIATTNETAQIVIPHVILVDYSTRHIGLDSEGNPLYFGVRNGSVKVKLPGDVDGDRDVDYDDFIVLAGVYGTSNGEPFFDERADFDRDSHIDYDDFILLAGNYGETY